MPHVDILVDLDIFIHFAEALVLMVHCDHALDQSRIRMRKSRCARAALSNSSLG
jgi:hypothetical protein